MTLRAVADAYIQNYRDDARREMNEFRDLPSLRDAIHHAALCHWLPCMKRHPHQYRIPAAQLHAAERALQGIAKRLARCKDFETLHDEVAGAIGGLEKIGPLALYDITRRTGAHLGKSPRVVYLHRGAAEGACHLGLSGATLDKRSLPAAFSRLTPAEIEDCLCIYKADLAGMIRGDARRSLCTPRRKGRRSVCGGSRPGSHEVC